MARKYKSNRWGSNKDKSCFYKTSKQRDPALCDRQIHKIKRKKVKVEEEDAFEELEEDEDTDAAELNINANTFY